MYTGASGLRQGRGYWCDIIYDYRNNSLLVSGFVLFGLGGGGGEGSVSITTNELLLEGCLFLE